MTFFKDQHHFGLRYAVSGDHYLEKWQSRNNAMAGVLQNLIHWFPVPADKSLGTTNIMSYMLKSFSTESDLHETQVCKCGPQHCMSLTHLF